MVSITLSVSKEVKEQMAAFDEMNWSGFIRKQIERKVQQLLWEKTMLKQLESEKALQDWAVSLQKSSRKGRLNQLKKQGLLS